ncbi:protein NPGR2-like isoform X2 [Trifolium pratense]|uniref:Uncharacterized protein n=1 Tax=Trifolium pratense TaxID=57577 RepID=A0ACB0K395_TRIPR|nr:protein NPGR2-like isoform X2 [Trifolium pratense]CAJ2651799.1 unnamed protein product [Trifolium pratense]
MKFLRSGEQQLGGGTDETYPSSHQSLVTNHFFSASSANSFLPGKLDDDDDHHHHLKPDTGNIEEAELSLRESGGVLNYEEARALLGRYEYQKGNLVSALHVFEGIDIGVVTPKIKIALSRNKERRKKHSHNHGEPEMSIHSVGLLLESLFLKAKSLQALERFKEAAQSCKVIMDIVESSLPEGLPDNFGAECKLQETVSKAVELLPELWKLADCPREATLSYRRALLHQWNLDARTTSKIQKEFVVFLLYSGGEVMPPNLRSQMDGSFVPGNNIEEAILLLMILLRKVSLKRIEWDPSILDHLSFALSVSGDLSSLANNLEELLPGIIHRSERFHTLALCYYGAEEGVSFSKRAVESLDGRCKQLEHVAKFYHGVSLSAHSKLAVSDFEKFKRQSEALQALETAGRMTGMKDPLVLYHLSLEYAEQRKLDEALYYAKCVIKLEGGSNVKGWLLLARILSARKQFLEAESIINAALDQTGKWDQGDLLRTKAKIQIARGQLKNAIETYSQLLAVLQIQRKSFGSWKKLYKDNRDLARNLEVEIWHDLAHVYISLSQWHDAEVCLSKSKAIKPYSASRCHALGIMYEAKGLYNEALKAFGDALNIKPGHVPSSISTAVVLRRCSNKSNPAVRSFFMDALRHDRLNDSAWYNLGLYHKAEGTVSSLVEATECFQAAQSLEESTPLEPFR